MCDLLAAGALVLALGGGAMSTPARRRLIRDFKKLQQVRFLGGFFFLSVLSLVAGEQRSRVSFFVV